MVNSFYRGAAAIILVFDIIKRDSFLKLPIWMSYIEEYALEGAVVCLIGNKADLAENRTVSFSEANTYAIERNMPYFETSAKRGDNVENVFKTVTNMVLQRMKEKTISIPILRDPNAVGVDDEENDDEDPDDPDRKKVQKLTEDEDGCAC